MRQEFWVFLCVTGFDKDFCHGIYGVWVKYEWCLSILSGGLDSVALYGESLFDQPKLGEILRCIYLISH